MLFLFFLVTRYEQNKVRSTFTVAFCYKKKCKLQTSYVLLVGYNMFDFITCFISNKYMLYIYQ